MSNQDVAYLRVSSVDQSVTRQQEAMKTVPLDKVFTEKASAKNTNRPMLQECLEYCREGDTLHVHSIDRIARNLKDLQNIIDHLVEKAVTVHFHKEGLIFIRVYLRYPRFDFLFCWGCFDRERREMCERGWRKGEF